MFSLIACTRVGRGRPPRTPPPHRTRPGRSVLHASRACRCRASGGSGRCLPDYCHRSVMGHGADAVDGEPRRASAATWPRWLVIRGVPSWVALHTVGALLPQRKDVPESSSLGGADRNRSLFATSQSHGGGGPSSVLTLETSSSAPAQTIERTGRHASSTHAGGVGSDWRIWGIPPPRPAGRKNERRVARRNCLAWTAAVVTDSKLLRPRGRWPPPPAQTAALGRVDMVKEKPALGRAIRVSGGTRQARSVGASPYGVAPRKPPVTAPERRRGHCLSGCAESGTTCRTQGAERAPAPQLRQRRWMARSAVVPSAPPGREAGPPPLPCRLVACAR